MVGELAMACFGEGSGTPMGASRHIRYWPPAGLYLIPLCGRDYWIRTCSVAHSHRNAAAGAMSEARASEGTLATAGQDPFLTLWQHSHVAISPQEKALFPEALPAKHARASFVPFETFLLASLAAVSPSFSLSWSHATSCKGQKCLELTITCSCTLLPTLSS